jgi:FecR protein
MYTIKLFPKSLLLLSALLLSKTVYASDPIHVGSATTVVNDVFTTISTGETRVKTNDDLFFKQQVLTKDNSTLTVTFRDDSTFSVAPQSVVVLDEFVFNPSENVLEKTINVIKGSFRYISGFPIKNSVTKIVTPFGTAGIRGSAVQGVVSPKTGLTMNVGSGVVDFKTKDGKVSVINEGETLSLTADCDRLPSVPAAAVANSMQYIDSSFMKMPVSELTREQFLANAVANNLPAASQKQAYAAAQGNAVKPQSAGGADINIPTAKLVGDPQEIINKLIQDMQNKNNTQVDNATRNVVAASVASGMEDDRLMQVATNAVSGAKNEHKLHVAATIINTLHSLKPDSVQEIALKLQQSLPSNQQFELPSLIPNDVLPRTVPRSLMP